MLRSLLVFPALIFVMILQMALFSRMPLLNGHADLLLVVLAAWGLQEGVESPWQWGVVGGALAGFVSKAPWLVVFAGYLILVSFAQAFQRRVWQAPLLAMFSVTFAGTLVLNLMVYGTLRVFGSPIPFDQALGLVLLPSLLLNLLLAIPVYYLLRDLARWMYPGVEEV